MIVAGIDVGGKNVHVAIVRDGDILAKAEAPSGIKKAEAAEQLYGETLKQAGLKRDDVERVVATGGSGQRVAFADGIVPDAAADARGVIQLIPSARTVIDVGAEEGRAIKISPEGKVLDFAINEKLTIHSGASALIGFCGVLLILRPEGLSTPEMGDLWGLTSGFTAGYAIVSLKRARTTEEPITILLFIMGCGLVMSSVIMPFVFVVPNITLFLLLVCTSILAVIGQLFITYGFRYVSSLEGSIISSMRIFVVAILGVLFMGDRLTWSIFVGALVITFSIVLLNVGQDQNERQWVENGK